MLDDEAWRNLALAAMCGSIAAVDATAHGRGDDPGTEPFEALVGPLFERDPGDAAALFPRPELFKPAIDDTARLLKGEHSRQSQLARYLIGILDLASRLQRKPELAHTLGERLDALATTPATERVAELGALYEQTIATLGRRIQVIGDPAALQRPATAARIRSLLLAAIRFAWLWKQLGGRRWHLVLRRQPLLVALSDLAGQL